jgi:hypothetical protein
MESRNQRPMTGEHAVLSALELPQLREVTGGTLWVSDGYCVSPFPIRHLPLAALPEQLAADQTVIGPR